MTATKTLTIVVEPDTFEMNSSGSVIGKIFFNLDGYYFPDNVWFDFPVPILSWWTESLLKLVTGAEKDGELLFMDGPQFVGLAVLNGQVWSVTFLKDTTDSERQPEPPRSPADANGAGRASGHKCEILATRFTDSLLEAINATIMHCVKVGFRSKDIEELISIRDRLVVVKSEER